MAGKGRPKLLFVDDEERVTQGLRVILRREFDVKTANTGAGGLKLLLSDGPFAVVVSDMRMPEMNGAEFLTLVRQADPLATRVLLTGHADQDDAIAAVNQGGIFRFLTKPCPSEELKKYLAEALAFHELMMSERELLHGTLRSSVELLMDIIGLLHPIVSGYMGRTRLVVEHLVTRLDPPESWRFDVAARLSLLGCLTLPPGLMDRVYGGVELTEEEALAFGGHTGLAASLIEDTPRLEEVAAMVARQSTAASLEERQGPPTEWDPVVLGGELLRIAAAFLQELSGKTNASSAVNAVAASGEHDEALLSALAGVQVPGADELIFEVTARDLLPGMQLAENLLSKDGVVLAAMGTSVNATLRKLILNFANRRNIQEPVQVRAARRRGQDDAA